MSTRLTSITLRAGSIADLAEVDALMAQAFDPRFGEGWTRSQCTGVLALPGVWLLLAELEDAPAGFALARSVGDEAELLLIAVAPAQRRRGVARALLRGIVADCRDRGVARLHLEVRENNDAARLYRAAGFVQVGERPGYYRGRDGRSYAARTLALPIDADPLNLD